MTIALVGVHTTFYAELASLTWDQNKKLFCKRHGFIGEDRLLTEYNVNNICFDKMRLVLEYFANGADWVWATGTDSMVTDFTNNLSAILKTEASFIVASDRNSINADSFLVKNNVFGRQIMDFVLSRESTAAEQQAVIDAFNEVPPGTMQLVPQRLINSYNYDLYPCPQDRFDKLGTDGHWQYGDLLIHWPGYSSRPDLRCEWARAYMNRIKYE